MSASQKSNERQASFVYADFLCRICACLEPKQALQLILYISGRLDLITNVNILHPLKLREIIMKMYTK